MIGTCNYCGDSDEALRDVGQNNNSILVCGTCAIPIWWYLGESGKARLRRNVAVLRDHDGGAAKSSTLDDSRA